MCLRIPIGYRSAKPNFALLRRKSRSNRFAPTLEETAEPKLDEHFQMSHVLAMDRFSNIESPSSDDARPPHRCSSIAHGGRRIFTGQSLPHGFEHQNTASRPR